MMAVIEFADQFVPCAASSTLSKLIQEIEHEKEENRIFLDLGPSTTSKERGRKMAMTCEGEITVWQLRSSKKKKKHIVPAAKQRHWWFCGLQHKTLFKKQRPLIFQNGIPRDAPDRRKTILQK